MNIEPFRLERFFDKYEFKVERQISASDCRTVSIEGLLDLAGGGGARDSVRRSFLELELGYTESRGAPQLRNEIAGLYTAVRPEGVLVAAPEEAIFLMLQAHLHPGDHVVVMSPAYQSLVSVPESIGCDVDLWPVELSESDETAASAVWRYDLDVLEGLLTERTKMVVVNLPHNPTGYCMNADEKRRLVELLRSRGIVLFSDEMYWQLEYDERADATPLCDLYDRAVSLSGLSKSYGLPGLRIGWLASRSPALLEPAAQLKDYTTICSAAPSEFLGRIAVAAGTELVGRNLSLVRSNLALLEEFVSRHSQRMQLPPGMGGSVVFPRFVDGTSASDFSQRLLDERNLLLLPGDLFGMPSEFFRIGLGREDLDEGLTVVEKELEK